MRFLLYNIRYGAGAGRTFHLPVPFSGYVKGTRRNFKRIASFIEDLQPDIAGLIEVDLGSYRSRWKNQAERLADELGHYHVYQSKYCGECFMQHVPILNRQGNAFLTSERIEARRFHRFDSGVKRLVIELELESVVVMLVHLSLKFRHRHDQLRTLLTMVESVKKPLILAGDFNPLRGERELDLFLAASGLENANREGTPTHPSRNPDRQLDFILHSREIEPTGFEVMRRPFSDHLPVVFDFRIPDSTATGTESSE